MTAQEDQEDNQHHQHQPEHQPDVEHSRSSSSSSLSSSISSIHTKTMMITGDKSESIASNTPATVNENGKRSRWNENNGNVETPEGGTGGEKQQQQQHSGTVSCSENQSQSESSSLSSLQKVARLDGHNTASQSQQQSRTSDGGSGSSSSSSTPAATVPAPTATAITTSLPAAPGVVSFGHYHHPIASVHHHQQLQSPQPHGTAVSIIPLGGSTYVQQQHHQHPLQPQHASFIQHPSSGSAAPGAGQQAQQAQQQAQTSTTKQTTSNGNGGAEKMLRPFPYFYYRDFSHIPDPDPLSPLTAPGRVPNFPAKMHSILSRADLVDVVSWCDHGRAWRVLKPREFEVKVIPTYFEHAKFSSFIRQANGWGFRRITQGKDRNSYYHEMFLRGLPHLCKMMKRPGVAEKQAADPDQEPDFHLISQERPLPERAQDESILLQCTLQGGPKARMPIYFGALTASMPGAQVKPEQPNHISPPTSVQPGGEPQHRTIVQGGHPSSFHLGGGALDPNTSGNLMVPMPSMIGTSANTKGGAGTNVYHVQKHQNGNSSDSAVAVVDPTQPLQMPANTNPQFAAGFAAAQKQFQAMFGHALARVSTSPHVNSVANGSGISHSTVHAPNASQQQHFAPLLPRPQHQPHNAQVIMHPMIHGQHQQHIPGAVAQPYVQHVTYQPLHVNGGQAQTSADHRSQQYQNEAHYLQPVPISQINQHGGTALGVHGHQAPSPGVHYTHNHASQPGQQQHQQNDSSEQQHHYYVGASAPHAASPADSHHQAAAVAVQHS